MIEVRVDVVEMDRITNDVSHSIEMVKCLKAAGIPLRGILLTKGIERGYMTWAMQEDLEGDTWVINWYDTFENPSGGKFKRVSGGHGHAYTYSIFQDMTAPQSRYQDDEL